MSHTDTFDIDRLHWGWASNLLHCRAGRLLGGNLPNDFRAQTLGELHWEFPPTTDVWRLGGQLTSYLAERLEPLEPIDVGGDASITGDFDGAPGCYLAPSATAIYRYFVYTNGFKKRVKLVVSDDDIPEPYLLIKREILRACKERLMEVLFERLVPPNIKANPEKWRGMKTEVFISYRGSKAKIATDLFHMLGEYGDQSVFLPRMDKVDMQAGNWLDQLMQMIERCDVFMPLLTNDYLNGPISRPELDQALRAYYQKRSKRVVPLLIEGGFDNYENHFIGGFHIVDVRKGLGKIRFEDIANLCLGLTRNPYE